MIPRGRWSILIWRRILEDAIKRNASNLNVAMGTLAILIVVDGRWGSLDDSPRSMVYSNLVDDIGGCHQEKGATFECDDGYLGRPHCGCSILNLNLILLSEGDADYIINMPIFLVGMTSDVHRHSIYWMTVSIVDSFFIHHIVSIFISHLISLTIQDIRSELKLF